MGERSHESMRQRADWMAPIDDSILEKMRDDGNITPLAISREGEVERLDIGSAYAGDRLRELSRYGLVERYDRGLYRLTENGMAYLNEKLDASALTPSD